MRLAVLPFALLAACGAGGAFYPPDPDAGAAAPDLAVPGGSSEVQVYIEPQAGLAPILTALAEAKRTIFIETYLITDGRVINALIAEKKRGKTVRVILDRAPQGLSNQDAYDRLARGGVAVQWSSEAFTFTHVKMMILDGEVLWAMTMNFSASAVADNREYLLVDRDPGDVAEATRVFEADWAKTTPEVGRLVVAPLNARQKLDTLFDSAASELLIEWESLSDGVLGSKLVQRVKAGVKVKIIAPANVVGSPTGMFLLALKASGVEVRLIGAPDMHAKMMVADRARGFIGSVNGTTNSLDRNREVGVVWSSPDVARQCAAQFDADFAAAKPL